MTMQNTQAEFFTWTLGDRMKKAMRVADISRAEMADYLGVEPTTVSTWMSDRIRPGTQTLRLWAMRTGAPYTWLVTGEYTPRDLNPEPTDIRKLRNLSYRAAQYIGSNLTEAA